MNYTRINTFFITITLFFFSFFVNSWNLNGMGQVWDEASYLRDGYNLIEMIRKGDFANDLWWKQIDHPPLSKYGRGLVSYLDIERYTADGQPIFRYDLTFDRLLSVFLVALTTVLVFLIANRYLSITTGIFAAIIFTLLPILIGHARIGLLEPFLLFFYTASVFTFILFLEKPSVKQTLFAGIILGLAMLSKETNIVLLPPFLLLLTFIYQRYNNKSLYNKQFIVKLAALFSLAGFTFFLFWPMPFFHMKEMVQFTYDLRFETQTAIPEVFFGRLQLVPPWYFLTYFLITTPLLVLLFFFNGLYKTGKSKNWFLLILALWFLFPFLQSFYHNRQQGIRYIIQIYVPFAIIAAIGFEHFISQFVIKNKTKLLLFIPVILYLSFTVVKISPYYLDYFNELVGGAQGVYEKRLFHLSWWGQGNREAGFWLEKHVEKGAFVGLAIGPTHVLPKTEQLSYEVYDSQKTYDYVVISFYEVIRIGFDDTPVKKDYHRIYSVQADGARLIDIYKRKE